MLFPTDIETYCAHLAISKYYRKSRQSRIQNARQTCTTASRKPIEMRSKHRQSPHTSWSLLTSQTKNACLRAKRLIIYLKKSKYGKVVNRSRNSSLSFTTFEAHPSTPPPTPFDADDNREATAHVHIRRNKICVDNTTFHIVLLYTDDEVFSMNFNHKLMYLFCMNIQYIYRVHNETDVVLNTFVNSTFPFRVFVVFYNQ